jgi:short-subunit dehydrogenase
MDALVTPSKQFLSSIVYMVMEKLNGKKVLVTGASGAIGSAVVKQLAASGALVYITGRDAERLKKSADESGIPMERMVIADLSNETDCKLLADKVNLDGRPLDILVNAAGIGIIKPFEQLSTNDFERSMQINFFAAVRLLHDFLPGMKSAGKGIIINIPGVLGKTPMSGATAYAASKYALNGMLKSLREELKRTEIRITQLYLGGVDSPFWDNIDLRVQRDKMIAAQEVGKAVWFLCQQPSSGVVSEMVLQPFNHQVI